MFRAALITTTLILSPAAFAAEKLGMGSFTGKSRHVASGTVTIVDEGNRTLLVLGNDFRFDGAPDPKVALGRDGYDADTLLAPLASNSGSQTYVLPASIDASAYNEVWIWCEEFNVPLAMAPLN